MSEKTTASAQFGSMIPAFVFQGATIQFYYDDQTLALTRVTAVGLTGEFQVKVTATMDSDPANPFAFDFQADDSIPIQGIRFASAALDGLAFSFSQIDGPKNSTVAPVGPA